METNPVPRGPIGNSEHASARHNHGDHHRGGGGPERDRRYQLTRTRSDEVTGGPSRKRAKHSRHEREPGRRAPRPRYLSETNHVSSHRYRLGSGEERSPTFPAGPSPLGSARFRRNEPDAPPPSSGHKQMAICRPRKDSSAGTTATDPEKSSPRPRAHRPPHVQHPAQTAATTATATIATAPPPPTQTSSPRQQARPPPPSGAPGSRYENNTYRSTLAENFIRSVSGTYKMMNRAEERKRILSNQLPSCIKSKSIANSFIFCTPADGDHLEAEIATTRKYQKRIVDFGRLDTVIQNVSCRIRRRPMSAALTPRQSELIRAVRVISVAFNRITFVARIKHYCDRDTRLSNYLRDELTKRCSEGSRLNCGIRQFVGLVDLEHHRDLCLVFVGMLCQTPHMWARSIRLLNRLKIFYQNTLMKLFIDEKMDPKDVFDLPYHSTAQKILNQVRQYTTSAFTLNDVVGGVVDAIRQRQSAPPLVFSSMPPRPPSSSSAAAAAAAAAAMAMAATMYDERYDPFAAPDAPQAIKSEEHREYTFYPETGRRPPKDRSFSSDDGGEDDEDDEDDDRRNSPYNDRDTDTDSSVKTSPGSRTPALGEYDDLLKNDGLRYDDPFSSSSSPSLPIEILQPLSPLPCSPPSSKTAKKTTGHAAYPPTADGRSGGSSPSSQSSSSSSSPYSSSSSSSGSGSSTSSHSSVSEEPMTVSPCRAQRDSATNDAAAAMTMLKYPQDSLPKTDFTFFSPVHYAEQDQELTNSFISIHVGRSSPPTARTQRECINIMLDSR